MRVNLTYTVSLDEVESRVASLIRESSSKLKEIAVALDKLANFVEEGQGNLARMQLDKTRMDLANIDLRLIDCDSILESYMQTVEHLNQERAESFTPVAHTHPEEDTHNDEER